VGKTKRSDKEFTKEQRLSKENRELKRELSHLRKQIARLDGDRFETLRQMVADQEESMRFQNISEDANPTVESLKREWKCRECEEGFLEIVLYSKMGQTHYYRTCSECDHRTKGKRYGESVKGIIKK
jgi:predicted RNase H-like nuclease (RuvC/YqgF family)